MVDSAESCGVAEKFRYRPPQEAVNRARRGRAKSTPVISGNEEKSDSHEAVGTAMIETLSVHAS
jgi:hypothetical protein